MTKITGLSGNEIYCLDAKGYDAGDIVIGNCVNSMGFLRSLGSGLSNLVGGEVTQVTQQIHDARQTAFTRMVAEAKKHRASGVAGVASGLMHQNGQTEFLFTGSCVHAHAGTDKFFTAAGNAQELYCHMDAGYMPLQHVFGNVAYSVGIGGGLLGALKTLGKGEIKEYSNVFNLTRHQALNRLINEAKREQANVVVGIRTHVMWWHAAHEMTMTGTASFNAALPSGAAPVTSDLTGEELWTMTKLGYAPIRLLLSTSVYSLGVVGGLKSFFKSFVQGEIPELSKLVLEAREVALGRLRDEASALGAATVAGTKTYIYHLGNGLIEFLAIGTALKKVQGVGVRTPELPAQAILHDKDTWFDGGGFTLEQE
ncbi:MAG TPA: heavy metal-binding domain-containing protein [Rudaea sp.]|nr:heavy metal-binding domain-containing protein [Rudaea sp.]